MDTCKLCKAMFGIFQLLVYMTFFYIVVSVILNKMTDFIPSKYILYGTQTTSYNGGVSVREDLSK